MYVLAVTGGVGSGKTTAARLMSGWGAVLLELDDVAKAMISADGPLVDAVASEFGSEVRAVDGGIDTARLAEAAFASPEDARRLDAVMHPGVRAAVAGALDMLAAQDPPPGVVVVDIPLLVEAPGFFELVDAVLAISADEDARLERLAARGMSEEQARARMACQADDHERRAIADWVIANDGTPEEFRRAIAGFWEGEVLPRVS
jgi:dephospho-CoA kinase